MESCLLLNTDYTFLNIVGWKKAVSLIYKEKVEVIKESDKVVRTVTGMKIVVPSVIRLLTKIKSLYKSKVPYSKRNVYIRDNMSCVYCGVKSNLTIDHVIPKSRGGKSNFLNCVSSCKKCNNRKMNKTPDEVGMKMSKEPYAPTILEFLLKKMELRGFGDILRELWND